MIAHAERSALGKRLAGKLDELGRSFTGTVFRFIAPKYSAADEMFAGEGPRHADGRWLAKGRIPEPDGKLRTPNTKTTSPSA
jgi:hypothetical protein